ncbi:MAG: hypothetical protein BWZ08_02808 [candidate division BRC1 bacterium ADurb.BinA292]|nr:MAG: hypothetical protein BWZ08_02808 [candidate division BRC1 bacterium ADurb.BinA292]
MLPERYDPDDWWGPGYRAVFDNPTGDVVHDFLPQNPAEILPRLPQILEHARAYIEYRHRRCRWAINEIRRDIVADQIEFKHALEWAVRSPGGIEKLLADIEKEPRYKELAAWTRYEWIRRNTPEEFRTRHAEAVARLLKRGTAELAARPPVVPEPTLSLFGLDPLSPPEQYEQDVRLQPWRLSVQWAITALQLLDLIEGRLELRFENRGRRPLVLPHEGHPDA